MLKLIVVYGIHGNSLMKLLVAVKGLLFAQFNWIYSLPWNEYVMPNISLSVFILSYKRRMRLCCDIEDVLLWTPETSFDVPVETPFDTVKAEVKIPCVVDYSPLPLGWGLARLILCVLLSLHTRLIFTMELRKQEQNMHLNVCVL